MAPISHEDKKIHNFHKKKARLGYSGWNSTPGVHTWSQTGYVCVTCTSLPSFSKWQWHLLNHFTGSLSLWDLQKDRNFSSVLKTIKCQRGTLILVTWINSGECQVSGKCLNTSCPGWCRKHWWLGFHWKIPRFEWGDAIKSKVAWTELREGRLCAKISLGVYTTLFLVSDILQPLGKKGPVRYLCMLQEF